MSRGLLRLSCLTLYTIVRILGSTSSGFLKILAALLGGWFLIYIGRRNARRKAGQKLIDEFANVEVAFDQVANVQLIHLLLKKAEPKLEEKVLMFKRHLHPKWGGEGFLSAWENYKKEDYWQYIPHTSSWRDKDDRLIIKEYTPDICKTTFKENVNNILKYAKQI